MKKCIDDKGMSARSVPIGESDEIEISRVDKVVFMCLQMCA
jgi:hypothetical protein